MRLFNRLAQRYLVRRDTPLPVVGVPGPDLAASSDWTILEAAESGTYHIMPYGGRDLTLGIGDDGVALHRQSPDVLERGSWRFESVDGDDPYQRIIDAGGTGRVLRAADPALHAATDLEVTVGTTGTDERAAMWRIDRECVADARSIHLCYPTTSEVALFYNEIYPRRVPPGTYFCTSGFGTNPSGPGPCGYAGIQRRVDGSRIAIFSVWHRMADNESPVAGGLATTVAMSPDAYKTSFRGEGSGSSIRYPLAWQSGSSEPIRFVVVAGAQGDDTVLSAYVARGDEPWIRIGAIRRAGTGGRFMTNLYGFIEDFARNGNTPAIASEERSPYRLRAALFANPWIGTSLVTSELQPLSEVRVTAYGPHPLENLSALETEIADFGVFVATGTALATQPNPIGKAIIDRAPGRRALPSLDGVPGL